MHPPMSQPSVNPENTPQNNDEMHDAKSDVPFSQPESVTLNSVETFLLAGLNRMVEPCEQQEKSNVSISDLNSSVQAISESSLPDKPPDPPDSTSTSELAFASVTSVNVLIDDHLVNEISVGNGQFLVSTPTSVDNGQFPASTPTSELDCTSDDELKMNNPLMMNILTMNKVVIYPPLS